MGGSGDIHWEIGVMHWGNGKGLYTQLLYEEEIGRYAKVIRFTYMIVNNEQSNKLNKKAKRYLRKVSVKTTLPKGPLANSHQQHQCGIQHQKLHHKLIANSLTRRSYQSQFQ